MKLHEYHPNNAINAFVFDCDGTLSSIEGIDVLAEENGVGNHVKALTAEAMGRSGLTHALYCERLSLVKPSYQQVVALDRKYYDTRIPELRSVLHALRSLNKFIYIASAGVNPAVKLFAKRLEVPEENVFAVDLSFSETGDYESFDGAAYTCRNDGKRVIADELKKKHGNIMWIGDGMNDVVVKPVVERFVGFGGAVYRQSIADLSDFYITCFSMSPVLMLGLTKEEVECLDDHSRFIYEMGVQAV